MYLYKSWWVEVLDTDTRQVVNRQSHFDFPSAAHHVWRLLGIESRWAFRIEVRYDTEKGREAASWGPFRRADHFKESFADFKAWLAEGIRSNVLRQKEQNAEHEANRAAKALEFKKILDEVDLLKNMRQRDS